MDQNAPHQPALLPSSSSNLVHPPDGSRPYHPAYDGVRDDPSEDSGDEPQFKNEPKCQSADALQALEDGGKAVLGKAGLEAALDCAKEEVRKAQDRSDVLELCNKLKLAGNHTYRTRTTLANFCSSFKSALRNAFRTMQAARRLFLSAASHGASAHRGGHRDPGPGAYVRLRLEFGSWVLLSWSLAPSFGA